MQCKIGRSNVLAVNRPLLEIYFNGGLIITWGDNYNTPQLFRSWVLLSVFGALFRDFSSVGSYSRSLARPNKGKLVVTEVNGALFPLVKIDFSAIFQKNFPIFL